MIVFLIASLEILGLSQVNDFLKNVVLGYLPNVIVAALILVVAAFIAHAMQRIVVGSAKAARVPSTHPLGGLTKWSIWASPFWPLCINWESPELSLKLYLPVLWLWWPLPEDWLWFGRTGRGLKYIEHLRKDIGENH